ncbi:GNAT family N-acetyltransferase [Curtobacterium sp. VKM Ac-1395]|uniref:GNAT family N-acetyltransferase n=1 Tax=Curtobacterium sp. VKM Ac-1395 TaxID=2783815 RepID=UPI00188AD954|nr:GNAT family N-acetyltransferase [Curtobacterium sp. VKM Ac-1395]MBF4588694.1 GNAT family N-acetyltransferase [Curtobacterium sp. VKM Ac-1395]
MKVLPADAPERAELEAQGWTVVARSFGAQLDAHAADQSRLQGLVARAVDVGPMRELSHADVDAVLALDALTIGDYPGSIATQHTPLDRQRATPSESRRAFGVVLESGELVAMTFVDVDGSNAESDFTVVHPAWRGRGLGVAAKAASVLALLADGVTRFRTGGSADNAAILAANDVVGYVRDEEWVTLEPGGR